MRGVRGGDIAMIFQEPMTALNPLYTVGNQIARGARAARGRCGRTRRARAPSSCCDRTGIPEPETARRRLSAPALGRPAPARDDRDGARLPAEAADRRRADHRARRHDPGADPGAARRPAARDGHGAAVHHARPEPGAPLHAPRRRDGARPAGRAGDDRARCSRSRSIRYTQQAARQPARSASCEPVRGRRADAASAATTSASTSPSRSGWFRKTQFDAVQRRDAAAAARRDARHRRRIGLGQDDARHGAARAAADRARARVDARRHAHRRRRPRHAARDAAAHAGRVPGSVRVAEPAHDDRADRRRGPGAAPAGAGRRPSASSWCCEMLDEVGLSRAPAASTDVLQRYPHEFSRRPAPAHRDRARGRAAARRCWCSTSRRRRSTSRCSSRC